METDKAAMRHAYRRIRDEYVAGLSPQDQQLSFSRPPSPMAALLQPDTVVAGYIAKDSEANPAALLTAADSRGCITALPYVTSRVAPMQFLRWAPGDPLEPGPFGLSQPRADAEPLAPDILLVPLVAFDSRLMRLGQGAGHYDRALSLLPDSMAIGIAWSVQHAPALETDPWDMPMNAVLTEKSWITL